MELQITDADGNNMQGITQPAVAGKVCDAISIIAGLVTEFTQVTPIADGTHSLICGSYLNTSGGRITGQSSSSQGVSKVLIGPITGPAAAPTFRALALTDLPTILPGGGFINVTFDGGTSNIFLDTDFTFDAGYSL